MPDRFLRPLLIVEFLIALQAFYAIWETVGGHYHMELTFWPWKLGIGFAAAGLIVAITANLLQNDGRVTRRGLWFCSLLITVLAVAGVVTYYTHLNEPADQDDDDDDAPAKISGLIGESGLRAAPAPGSEQANFGRVRSAAGKTTAG